MFCAFDPTAVFPSYKAAHVLPREEFPIFGTIPVGYLNTLSEHRSTASGVYTTWQMIRKDYRREVISARGTMRLSTAAK